MEQTIIWVDRKKVNPSYAGYFMVAGYAIDSKYKQYVTQSYAYFHKERGWKCEDVQMSIEFWAVPPKTPLST